MSRGPKIGVLTFHKCINYGSYWQARCLAEGLRGEGFDAELIDHHCSRVIRAELRCALQPTLPARSSRQRIRGYSAKVRSFVDAFSRLPLSAPVALDEPNSIDGYDAVVIGSDEVWNLSHPWYGGEPLFYGAGLKTERLIAYAGSFGSYSCHWGLHEYWADRLKDFHALSVRDENSYWLVRGSTGREPPLVLDPCLLFPHAIDSEPAPAEKPYALVYGHSFPAWYIDAARTWANAAGLSLLSVGYHNGFADEHRLGAGPLEFAKLMKNASAVLTNFFHGCVFSLVDDKPFAAVTSEYRGNKLRGLLTAVAAQERLVEQETPQRAFDDLLSRAPTPQVNGRIEAARERSREFLRGALCQPG